MQNNENAPRGSEDGDSISDSSHSSDESVSIQDNGDKQGANAVPERIVHFLKLEKERFMKPTLHKVDTKGSKVKELKKNLEFCAENVDIVFEMFLATKAKYSNLYKNYENVHHHHAKICKENGILQGSREDDGIKPEKGLRDH